MTGWKASNPALPSASTSCGKPHKPMPPDYRCEECRGTGNFRLSEDSVPGLLYKFKIVSCQTCQATKVNPIPYWELVGRTPPTES